MSEVSSETRFLHAVEMGLGAWQWGDRVVWQFGQNYSDKEVRDAFQTSIHEGIRLIDTAEAYGNGLSERLLGKFMQETDQPVLIATKYFPYPWRLTTSSIPRALKGSLERLGAESVDLYQIHGMDQVTPLDETLRALEDIVRSGRVRYIGVSNHGAWQIMKALGLSERHGRSRFEAIQAYYSIAGRELEREIVPMITAEKVGLMVWSPLAGGLLAGKYDRDGKGPDGARRTTFDFPFVDKERAFACIHAGCFSRLGIEVADAHAQQAALHFAELHELGHDRSGDVRWPRSASASRRRGSGAGTGSAP